MKNFGIGLVLVEVMLVIVAVLIEADHQKNKVRANRLSEPDTTVQVNPQKLQELPRLKILQSGKVQIGEEEPIPLDRLMPALEEKQIDKVRLMLRPEQAQYLSLVSILRKSGVTARIPVKEKQDEE
jgi:biopolymer transport protein ExbD